MVDNRPLRIYIAGPYTGKTFEETCQNVNNAIDAALKIWKRGHYPYIPHLTHFVDLRAKEINVSMKWEDYIKLDFEWLKLCDALLYLAPSGGASLELKRATELRKKIFYDIEEIPLAFEYIIV